jgi:hypothetical protein
MTPNRRDFLKDSAKKAAWAAPTVAILMSASMQPLQAKKAYHSDCRNPAPGTQGGRSPCAPVDFPF